MHMTLMKRLRLQLSLIDRTKFRGCPMTVITASQKKIKIIIYFFATKFNACSKKTRSLPSPPPPPPNTRWHCALHQNSVFETALLIKDQSTLNRTHLGLNENGSTSRSRYGCNDWGHFVLWQNSFVLRCQNSSINRSRDGPTLDPAKLEREWL